jgi:hypothetical protein
VATLKEVDSRLTALETKEDERWRETILRIKRIEHILIACAGGIIMLLVGLLSK